MNEHSGPRPSVILIGGTGRLGPYIGHALSYSHEVVVAAQRPSPDARIAGIDVADPKWWEPGAWASVLEGAGVVIETISAVLNLVASRAPDRARAVVVGAGSVRSLVAAAQAVAGLDPLTIHVGSVAEFRSGHLPPYAAGKVAARAEALRHSVTAVLTIGVVPRSAGSSRDALPRRIAAVIPEIAALPIATSTPEAVGGAAAYLIGVGRGRLFEHAGTTDVMLAGQRRPLKTVLDVRTSHHRWSGTALRALAHLPTTNHPGVARVVSLARMAAGMAENHYLAAESPIAARSEWISVPTGPSALTLVPPGTEFR